MATNKKTSVLVAEQLPDFVRDEGPKLQRFIEAYYEFMEQNGGAIDGSKNLLSYQDIDTTTNSFLQFFREEIYKNIPDSALIDKRLLAKHIREMYRTKGTEKSYKFLFRALYNEDVDFTYPGDFMLRTSDGRWVQEKYLRLNDINSKAASSLEGQIVTGDSTGAYARVENVDRITQSGTVITEIYLSNIVGTFANNETITSDVTSTTATIAVDSGAALQEKQGRYIGTRGQLSSDQRLQDSFYYQDYSYVLRSPQFVERYRETVLELLHPAGTKLFGETMIISPFSVRSDTTDTEFEMEIDFDLQTDQRTGNVVSIITGPDLRGAGRLFIPGANTTNTISKLIAEGIKHDANDLNAYAGIKIKDFGTDRLVFGNNTTFLSDGFVFPGFVKQNISNANNILGFGGTNFGTLQANDKIVLANTEGYRSQIMKVVSVAGASSLITSPAAVNTGFHQLFANSTTGGILALNRGLLLTDDVIIFDTHGSNPNAQHAVASLGSNLVMSIFPDYSGPPLSNGTYSLFRPGRTPEIPTFDVTIETFDSVAFRFDQV
tara:strand:- start:10921 stop:12564 length:1644 start_codon:yes stop_codon:yes gene_type:complete